MGKWLNQLREKNVERDREGTDKTDKTGGSRSFVSFVRSPSEHSVIFRPYGGAGWDEEDWQVAIDERAAIIEFDQCLPRGEAEALARHQMEAERKRYLQ
jgi:hypothetical protein